MRSAQIETIVETRVTAHCRSSYKHQAKSFVIGTTNYACSKGPHGGLLKLPNLCQIGIPHQRLGLGLVLAENIDCLGIVSLSRKLLEQGSLVPAQS